ncbi:MAG: accessory gene regulator B family protein [Lachnospiraceae bacterium]
MIQQNVVDIEEKEIYEYGIQHLLLLIGCSVTMLFLGLLMNKFIFTISFYLSYSVLRALLGGYHFKSKKKCIVASGLLYLGSVVLSSQATIITNSWICNLIILVMSASLVTIKLPLYRIVKDKINNKVRKYMDLLIGPVMFFLYIIARFTNAEQISAGIFIAILMCRLLLYAGKVRKKVLGDAKCL